MELPDWRTSSAGAKVRAALWLATEVGEGGTFTKAQLRGAFPNIEQVDRRMRDLRPEGWEILTFQEDRSLEPDELRLKTIGGRVWEPGYRSKARSAVPDRERQAAFLADNYQCVICGIAGGEAYPDDPGRVAKLVASRPDDVSATRTLCDRCRAGGPITPSAAELEESVSALGPEQRITLARWLASGQRERTQEEQLWVLLMRQPVAVRRALLDGLQ